MTLPSKNLPFCYSGVLALQIVSLMMIASPVNPASAQTPSDFVSRLKSLPPEAQSLPLQRYRYFYEQRAYPNQQIPPGAYQRALRDHEQKFGAIRPQLPPGAPPFNQNQWTLIG